MAVYVLSSCVDPTNPNKYTNEIKLPQVIPAGRYKIIEIQVPSLFNQVIEPFECHYTCSGAPITMPTGNYDANTIAEHIALKLDVYCAGGGDASYDELTGTITITINEDTEYFSVIDERFAQIIGFQTGKNFKGTNSFTGRVNLSPVSAIYVDIKESKEREVIDSAQRAYSAVILKNTIENSQSYRLADQAYEQYIAFDKPIKNVNVRFYDNFGVLLDNGYIDWTFVLLRGNNRSLEY